MPFRIAIKHNCETPRETWEENARLNGRYPKVQKSAPHGRRLAVVGGGLSVLDHLEELKAWDGDVWGINYTAAWLQQRGIDATLVTVDPGAFDERVKVPKAILATSCSPDLFAMIPWVQAFDVLEVNREGLPGGVTTATRVPSLAFMLMGYMDVSFFGCDGSREGRDHVDRHEGSDKELVIRAGGRDYVTSMEMLVQCEQLASLFVFDGVFHNRSGGLLKAMIEHPDTWEVVGVSPAMKEHLESVNGARGLYDGPYVPINQGETA